MPSPCCAEGPASITPVNVLLMAVATAGAATLASGNLQSCGMEGGMRQAVAQRAPGKGPGRTAPRARASQLQLMEQWGEQQAAADREQRPAALHRPN